ncbi:polynucleotide adenylyltransferase PcnB [Marinimicrobium sp. C6131]|uniref:polynucleotide adenylyltransferase PcnB n=1 Tax=Marinimicrobium sp. C6131 TaxID=3022676 RepID=UPI00223D0498|nr:polynucleotide adenylyltransferase PcnB [Marinimicrobium sp. C6131]UZJ46168.1 polynucleotide adenylyltransferase PcnB [Marinimicrobium sp. C6131]
MLRRLIDKLRPRSTTPRLRVVPRDQHNVSRRDISQAALRIMKRLEDAGYQAFLVGGGVRDLLLGGHPKDFDVATDATPEQIKRLFRGARIIGRRFQIVHVRMGREIIEVTTFRGHHEQSRSEDGMLLRDNVYGSLETDAVRRDFTVNALYYTLNDFAIHDYTGGLKDLERRTLRIIGDPDTRYKEDPVRMLRAVRFAAKLGFQIEPGTANPILELGELLRNIPPARLFEEVLKLFMAGSATATFTLMRDYRLLEHLFPATEAALQAGDELGLALIEETMANTDKRVRADKPVTPAFIYAALLWPPMRARADELTKHMPPQAAYQQAATEVIGQQLGHTALPKRFLIPMREMWDMQHRLVQRRHPQRLLEQPRFRAAYDFLILREAAGERLDGAGSWWTRFQEVDEPEQQKMIAEARRQTPDGKSGRRRNRKRRAPRQESPTPSSQD